MNEIFKTGIELGKKHYAELSKKTKRWKSRRVPKWMLDSILVPYYLTELNGIVSLYILQMPISDKEKAYYLLFSSERSTIILNST